MTVSDREIVTVIVVKSDDFDSVGEFLDLYF